MALSAGILLIFSWLAHQLFVFWWSRRTEKHGASILLLSAFMATTAVCEAVWYWVDDVFYFRICRAVSLCVGLAASFYLPFLITHLAKFATVTEMDLSNRALSTQLTDLTESKLAEKSING